MVMPSGASDGNSLCTIALKEPLRSEPQIVRTLGIRFSPAGLSAFGAVIPAHPISGIREIGSLRAHVGYSRHAMGIQYSRGSHVGHDGSPLARLWEKSRIFATVDTAMFAAGQEFLSGSGGGWRFELGPHSQDFDYPFEIVAQHAQSQLGFRFSQSGQ